MEISLKMCLLVKISKESILSLIIIKIFMNLKISEIRVSQVFFMREISVPLISPKKKSSFLCLIQFKLQVPLSLTCQNGFLKFALGGSKSSFNFHSEKFQGVFTKNFLIFFIVNFKSKNQKYLKELQAAAFHHSFYWIDSK